MGRWFSGRGGFLIDYKQWKAETKWEAGWWGDCANTLREELLQFAYAKRMGLQIYDNGRSPYNINLNDRSVLDIGGGPCSLLLKGTNCPRAVVIDPCEFPEWIDARYNAAGILFLPVPAERMPMFLPPDKPFTEVWIYNVLQHTMDPKLIIDNAKKLTHMIRLFEWIDTGISPGHLHELHESELNEWLGGTGTVEQFTEHGANGKAYYGAFPQ